MTDASNSPTKAVALVFARLSDCLDELQNFPKGEEFRYFARFAEFRLKIRDLQSRSEELVCREVSLSQEQQEAQTRLKSVRSLLQAAQHRPVLSSPKLQLHFPTPVCNSVSLHLPPSSPLLGLAYAASCPILAGEIPANSTLFPSPDSFFLPSPAKSARKYPDSMEFVDTLDSFQEVLSRLATNSELGVYILSENRNSYRGFTRLIGLVTPKIAVIIDAIALRPHLLALHPLFSNPNILKVLHNAQLTVDFLYSDLNLPLINSFDLVKTAKMLDLPSSGLSFLSQTYCGVTIHPHFPYFQTINDSILSKFNVILANLMKIYDVMREEVEVKLGTEAVKDAIVPNPTENSEKTHEKGLLAALKAWRNRLASISDIPADQICPVHTLETLSTSPVFPSEIASISPYLSSSLPYLISLHRKFTVKNGVSKGINPQDVYGSVGWRHMEEGRNPLKEMIGGKAGVGQDMVEVLWGSLREEKKMAGNLMMKMKKMGKLTYLNEFAVGNWEEKGEESGNLEWKVPENMEEIYELANNNRKKTKKGKISSETAECGGCKGRDLQSVFKEVGWGDS